MLTFWLLQVQHGDSILPTQHYTESPMGEPWFNQMFLRHCFHISHYWLFDFIRIYWKRSVQEIWLPNPAKIVAKIKVIYHSNHGCHCSHHSTHSRVPYPAVSSAQWGPLRLSSALHSGQCRCLAFIPPSGLFGKECFTSFNSSQGSWSNTVDILDPYFCFTELGFFKHEKWRLVVWFGNHGRYCWVFPLYCTFCKYLHCIPTGTQGPWTLHIRKTLQRRTWVWCKSIRVDELLNYI